jgi:outer membrane immunogenic protein
VAAAAGSIPIAHDVGTSGWIVSGQTGCNYQAASWVFGIETDISNGLDASATVATNVAGFFPLTSSVSQDMSWIGTTRGRLGWTWGSALLYATGGVAYAHTSFTYSRGLAARPITSTAASAGDRAAEGRNAEGQPGEAQVESGANSIS